MSQAPLTLDDLDQHLFKCADIIRNTVDKTDYKDYILPLVFYKTISDTYQDQYEQRLNEYGDPDIAKRPAFYEFIVPEDYSWDQFRSQTNRVDEFINEAFDALSEANEGKLEGVLRADYVRADGLSTTTDPLIKVRSQGRPARRPTPVSRRINPKALRR